MKAKGFCVIFLVFVFVFWGFSSFVCAGNFDYNPKIKEAEELIEQAKNLIATGDDEVASQNLKEAIAKINSVIKKGKCTPADHYMIMICYVRMKNLMPKGKYRNYWREKALKKAKYVATLGPNWAKLLQDTWGEYFIYHYAFDSPPKTKKILSSMYSLGLYFFYNTGKKIIVAVEKNEPNYGFFYGALYRLESMLEFCAKYSDLNKFVNEQLVPIFVRKLKSGQYSASHMSGMFASVLRYAPKNNVNSAEFIRWILEKHNKTQNEQEFLARLRQKRMLRYVYVAFDKSFLERKIGRQNYLNLTKGI